MVTFCNIYMGNYLFYTIMKVILDLGLQNLGDGDGNPVTVEMDFALGDRFIVGQHQDRVVLVGIEFNHRAAAHAQKLMHGDNGLPEHNGNLDFDVVER